MRLRDYQDTVLMGKGFEWTPAHTEAMLRFRRLQRSGEYPALSKRQPGIAALHGVGADHQRLVTIPDRAMTQHLSIQGLTGAGKSVFLTSLVVQMIHRKTGCIVVIDPKGDDYLIGHMIQAAHEAGRKFALFAPYFPHLSTRLNPLSTCQTPEEVEARIDPIIPPTKEPYWHDEPMSRLLLMARIHGAIGRPWALADLYRDVMHPQHRTQAIADYMRHIGIQFDRPDPSHGVVKSAYGKSGLSDPIADEAVRLLDTDISSYDQAMSNFRVSLSGIANNNLLSPKRALTWDDITGERMVVLVLTTYQLMGETGNKLGRLILQDFMGYCGHRQTRSTDPVHEPITVVADELPRMAYPDLAGQAATMRSANGRLIGAWQSRAGVMRAMGELAAKELFANFGTQVYFRLEDEDALTASRKFGMCEIPKFNMQANLRTDKDGDHMHAVSTAKQADKVPLIDPAWFPRLANGQCLASIGGGAHKIIAPYLGRPDYSYAEPYRDIIHELRSQPVTAGDGDSDAA